MTTPDEAARAVANTREFLIELLQRPRVPKEIREKAHRLLKHYPYEWSGSNEPVAYMDIADDGTRLAVRMFSDGSSDEVALYLGCDHCRHPLYAAIKCSQCGRVTE